jgi:hypothetical protein
MLSIILFVIYFVFSAIVIRKLVAKSAVPLSTTEVFICLSVKTAMACLYGWIFYHYYNGDDTWALHSASIHERSLLLENPRQFFREFTPISAWIHKDTMTSFISTYLSDLEYAFQAKLLALFNFLTGNEYYINTVFFSFITFWGHYLLFKLFLLRFPEKRRLLFAIIFLFPPAIFWLSGIRGDGLLFFFTMMVLYHFDRWITSRKRSNLWIALIGLLGMMIFRPPFAGLMLPVLIAWFIVGRHARHPVRTFAVVYGIGVILFFTTIFFSDRSSLPAMVANKQYDFLALKGNTAFRLDSLKPDVSTYAKVLPQAVNNTFLRPYLWEWKGPLQLVAALETLILWGLVLLVIVRPSPSLSGTFHSPLFLGLVFFSVTLYVFIGYTVPFPGAIVRYRVIAELFLICVLTINIRLAKKKHE